MDLFIPMLAEAASNTPAAVAEIVPFWAQILGTILAAIATVVLTPLAYKMSLRQDAEVRKAEAEAEAAKAAGTYNAMMQRKLLSERLKAFLLRAAANISERRFPELARNIKAGMFSLHDKEASRLAIKAELRKWGADLKQQAVDYFEDQGIDLVEEFGDKALDHLIEWAANKVSPFPGKETAVAMLQDNVSDLLIEKGVGAIRLWIDKRTDGSDEVASIPAQ